MKSKTISLFIAAAPAAVYAFASNPANLPLWVPSFCKSIARINGEWVAQSPSGTAIFTFAEPNAFGVLDHTVRLDSGLTFYNPMRVIANAEGSEVLFTLFQHAGMTDAQFAADAVLVESDLASLRRLVEQRQA